MGCFLTYGDFRFPAGDRADVVSAVYKKAGGLRLRSASGHHRSLSGVEGNNATTQSKIWTLDQFMPYMYILECADGSYYTGSTVDLERRLWEHQNGLGANHTAKRLAVKLVYCEDCDRIDDAFKREKQIQGWSRKKKEALMAGDTNQLHLLAECRNKSSSTSLTDRARSSSLSCRVSGDEPGVEGGALSGVEGNET